MNMIEHKRGRGRPVGSTLPVEQRRKRKDYRLSPTALAQIEQWKREQKETAFIEEAIAHYVAFLSGQYVAREEVEPLQSRISELEDDLRLAQGEITALKSSKHVAVASQPVPQASHRRAVSYQIIIKHERGDCPELPDGFRYDKQKDSVYRHPVHQVFSEQCPIDKARSELERLKAVDGIKELWLTKDGYGMEHERWLKKQDRWEKN